MKIPAKASRIATLALAAVACTWLTAARTRAAGPSAPAVHALDVAKLPFSIDGAVSTYTAATGTLGVRLVGSMMAKPGKFGHVMFDVRHTPVGKVPLGNRSVISVEVRPSQELVGAGSRNWSRAHRARLVVEDARGRRVYLPNADIVDRPRATDGWITLRGAPTGDVPMPLGFTDAGFDPRHVRRIGVNVEAFNREGEVVVGTVQVRNLSVALGPTQPLFIAPRDNAIAAGAAERARAMEARLAERCALGPASLILGVNLAWPTAKSPENTDLQLYGRTLDGGTPWWNRLWDMGEPAVAESVRADFRAIRDTFGPGAIVRVWLFGDARSGLAFDAEGTPLGFSERARANMRKLLDVAAAERVVLIPVLFDFGLADGIARNGPSGQWPVGEHADLVTDARKRAALAKIVTDFVKDTARHPGLLAWEPMNEPENAVAAITPETFGHMQRFLAQLTDAIHAGGELATTGHRNAVDPAVFMRDRIASDLGQVHYYPLLETRPNPSPFGIDLKRVFGPLPAGWGEMQAMPGQIEEQIRTARAAGHRYMLFWSWRGHMENGDGFAVQPYAAEIKKAIAAGAAGPRPPR